MRIVVDYKIKWIFRKNHAIRLRTPIYQNNGKGAGLEKPKKGKQDLEFINAIID